MNKGFYQHLAASNLKKNHQFTIPYLLTGICTIAMYYMIGALAENPNLEVATDSSSIYTIMSFGTVIVGIFSVVMLFYSDTFLMKRRKKELGLYNILGMEKRHIGIMLFFETLYSWLITCVLGILIGILFSKLFFMLLVYIVGLKIKMDFYISTLYIARTFLLFGAIYLVSFFLHLVQLKINNPIELLHSSNVGEREPKTKKFMAIIGFICLAIGYFIAITTTSPLRAIGNFLVAVILVIIATYLLFTAGSIAVLKLLRKNKNYYYKTRHFTAVSGLMYRMKQNAMGLASICILSTMVLVMVSTTVCLYASVDSMVKDNFPRNTFFTLEENLENKTWNVHGKEFIDKIHELGIKTQNEVYYPNCYTNALLEANHFNCDFEEFTGTEENMYGLKIIPMSGYEMAGGTHVDLKEDEVLMLQPKGSNLSIFTLLNQTFKVKGVAETTTLNYSTKDTYNGNYCIIIVKDEDVLKKFNNESKMANISYTYSYYFDLVGDNPSQIEATNKIEDWISKNETGDSAYGYSYNNRAMVVTMYQTQYGSFLFLGLFLGLLFLAGTVLIIYYKQVSEGYDDHDKFQIMQKVGMSLKEVRKSIQSQILLVFFLPLVTAVIHICFAFPLIRRLLEIFDMTNVRLFLTCTIACVGVFSVIYALVYALTARVYYKLVTKRD